MEKHFAIFDIGKTNAKFLLFNENEEVVESIATQIGHISDPMGHVGADGESLAHWMKALVFNWVKQRGIHIHAVNFSAHGAAWAHIDHKGHLLSPIYDYLLPLPKDIEKEFDEKYGLRSVAQQCGSPYAGMLNSGLQLYWIQRTKPHVHHRIHYSLHLPQYLSFALTTLPYSEMTSIGCHTMLWDLGQRRYHDWLTQEDLISRQAPIAHFKSTYTVNILGKSIQVGIGMHDSSASLYAIRQQIHVPFILLSTGTWCVLMAPGLSQNTHAATADDLYYLSPEGQKTYSKRFPFGLELTQWDSRLKGHFGIDSDFTLDFDPGTFNYIIDKYRFNVFNSKDHDAWKTIMDYPTAYHRLIYEQTIHLAKAMDEMAGYPKPQVLAVEGSFTRNPVFMGALKHTIKNLKINILNNVNGPALGAMKAIKESR